MKSKFEKRKEALTANQKNLNLWNSAKTYTSGQDWMLALFDRDAGLKSWDIFRAGKIKNIERDIRNLSAKI